MSSSPTADRGGDAARAGTGNVVVGRAGRAHGITGELSVAVLTDEPALRFAPGAELTAQLPTGGRRSLVIDAARAHGDRLLLRFAGVPDRTAAEGLAGSTLTAAVSPTETAAAEDEFFDHQLVGAAAVDRAGAVLGTVTDVLHHTAQDLLVVDPVAGGEDVLVPFVAAIVLAVDVADPAARRVTLDPPGGLFPGPDGQGPDEQSPADSTP